MKTQYLTISGQKVAWYESKPEGFPIILLHGNSLSANTFGNQFESESLSNYRLITFDFPGHGQSEKAKDPEKMYTLFGYSDLVAAFVNQLNIAEAIFVGHSMGGHVTLHSIQQLQEKMKGIVIFGTPPISIPMDMELAYHPNPAFALAFKDALTNDELLQLAGSFINNNDSLLEEIAATIANADPKMRLIMGESTGKGEFIHELEALNKSAIPIAVIHGEKDSMINPKYFSSIDIKNFWRKEAQIIKDSGHCPQLEKPEEFNRVLKDFIDDLIS